MSEPRNSEAALIRELRQGEARLRLATKSGNIGLWDWDLRANRVAYSPEWKSQLGHEPYEIGDTFEEWEGRLHPDDLAPSLQAVREFIAGSRPSYVRQFRMRHKDGSYRWILGQGALLLDDEGRPERMIGSHVDITAQKEAEETSKTEIRGILECLVDGLVVVDAETREILRVNRAMCELFGYTEEDLRRLKVEALHPPDTAAQAPRLLEIRHTPGNRVARAIPCRRADGSVFPADIGVQPIDLGGRTCVIGFIRDATESLLAERRLRESERQLQEQLAELANVYKNSPVGLCVLDRDLRYLRVNERLAEMNGKSIEEHLGRTVWEVLPELADHFAAMWRPIFATGGPLLDVEIEGETPKAPDLRRHWLASFFPITSSTGEVAALMSAVVEITDRKRAEERLRESEEKYRALIETTGTGFAILDGEGRVLDGNREFVRQTGHDALEEIRGHPVTEWTSPGDLERNLEAVRRCMEQGFIRSQVLDYVDREGRPTTVEINATVVGDGEGRRIMGLTRDITDRKRAEREREQLQAQLRQAQKMEAVGRLSGGIAHDFNNLLTVIEGNVAVATRVLASQDDDGTRDKLKATLAEIEHAASRASRLTHQLLTFSRKHVIEVRVLEVGAVVRDLEKMLRRLIREDITLRIACDPGAHLIEADLTEIEQVLINLAVNASDAMPDGGTLDLRVGEATLDDAYVERQIDARAGRHVVITVADNGNGMARETLDHLFEPFFTTKPYGSGTGLGLSIVYGIVRQAGGHITVESAPGCGTTFRLYLPAAQGATPGPDEAAVPEWPRGRGTVLLCEDEPLVRGLLASCLREGGYDVAEAENGEAAMRLAKENAGAFRLLITDVIMPGLKGDKVAAAVLEHQPGIEVLFMSGYAPDEINFESLAETGSHFLQKPFRPHVLLQRVRKILDDSRDGGAGE